MAGAISQDVSCFIIKYANLQHIALPAVLSNCCVVKIKQFVANSNAIFANSESENSNKTQNLLNRKSTVSNRDCFLNDLQLIRHDSKSIFRSYSRLHTYVYALFEFGCLCSCVGFNGIL